MRMKTTSDDLALLRKSVEVYKSYLVETRTNMIYFKYDEEQIMKLDTYVNQLDEAIKHIEKDWFDVMEKQKKSSAE